MYAYLMGERFVFAGNGNKRERERVARNEEILKPDALEVMEHMRDEAKTPYSESSARRMRYLAILLAVALGFIGCVAITDQ